MPSTPQWKSPISLHWSCLASLHPSPLWCSSGFCVHSLTVYHHSRAPAGGSWNPHWSAPNKSPSKSPTKSLSKYPSVLPLVYPSVFPSKATAAWTTTFQSINHCSWAGVIKQPLLNSYGTIASMFEILFLQLCYEENAFLNPRSDVFVSQCFCNGHGHVKNVHYSWPLP